jgi:hypothetical protein
MTRSRPRYRGSRTNWSIQSRWAAGAPTFLKIVLELGTYAETVLVTAAAALVDTAVPAGEARVTVAASVRWLTALRISWWMAHVSVGCSGEISC